MKCLTLITIILMHTTNLLYIFTATYFCLCAKFLIPTSNLFILIDDFLEFFRNYIFELFILKLNIRDLMHDLQLLILQKKKKLTSYIHAYMGIRILI